MDVGNAIKQAVRPNFLLSLVIALAVLSLVNGLLPSQYKLSRLVGGLFA